MLNGEPNDTPDLYTLSFSGKGGGAQIAVSSENDGGGAKPFEGPAREDDDVEPNLPSSSSSSALGTSFKDKDLVMGVLSLMEACSSGSSIDSRKDNVGSGFSRVGVWSSSS